MRGLNEDWWLRLFDFGLLGPQPFLDRLVDSARCRVGYSMLEYYRTAVSPLRCVPSQLIRMLGCCSRPVQMPGSGSSVSRRSTAISILFTGNGFGNRKW